MEDDKDDQEILQEVISQRSVQVDYHVADNGIECLSKLDSNDPFDIIVLDLNMPKMDGFETLKKIKLSEKFRNIPVYILTTSALNEHKLICSDLGAKGYYTKSLTISELTISVDAILNSES